MTVDGPNLTRRGMASLMLGAPLVLAGSEVAAAAPLQASPPTPWWVNVKDHGAVGDGIADDTAEIQAAINAVRTAGGGVVVLPAGKYKISATLQLADTSITATSYNAVSLQGVGPHATTILVTTGAYPKSDAVRAAGRDGTKHGVGALSAGARTVAVPAVLGPELEPGSIIGFEAPSPAVFSLIGRPRELHRVVSKSGTTVALDSPLLHDYDATAVAWRMYAPAGITVRDLAITTDPLVLDPVWACSVQFEKCADVAPPPRDVDRRHRWDRVEGCRRCARLGRDGRSAAAQG